MGDEWSDLTDWWTGEVADDAIFDTDVLPLVEELIGEQVGEDDGPWLDIGCGEGRVMRRLAMPVVGCDLAAELAGEARRTGPVVRCRLPDLGWVRSGSLAGAYAVLVIEHLADLPGLFRESGRAIRPGGSLVVVANHPAFTAAGAGPVVDLTDGEVLWRWGPYFSSEANPTEVGGGRWVTFHHRPLGEILTAAADAGWALRRGEERPLSEAAVAAHPGYRGQESVPRLLGLRWEKGPDRAENFRHPLV